MESKPAPLRKRNGTHTSAVFYCLERSCLNGRLGWVVTGEQVRPSVNDDALLPLIGVTVWGW
jgi:hypothetical protein